MRLCIFVFVINILLIFIWQNSVICNEVDPIGIEPFLENVDYKQSELGISSPLEEVEIKDDRESNFRTVDSSTVLNSEQVLHSSTPATWNAESSMDEDEPLQPKPDVNQENNEGIRNLNAPDTFVAKEEKKEDISEGLPYIEGNDQNLTLLESPKQTAEETVVKIDQASVEQGLEYTEVEGNKLTMDYFSEEDLVSMPSIIEPQWFPETKDSRDLQYLHLFQRRFKDSWDLQYIEQDFSFNWPTRGVKEWLQLRHNEQELLVGKLSTSLVILNPNVKSHRPPLKINVGLPITALETFTLWNFDLYQEEGIIVVASENKLLWYRFYANTRKFELFGKWDLGGHITQIAYLRQGFEDQLVVGYKNTLMQIFKFHLEHQQYWMIQELYIELSYREFVVFQTAENTVLALSHEELVTIYMRHSEYNQDFRLLKSLAAPGVASLCSFSLKGESYLAVTGYEAKILKYCQHEFQEVALLSPKFGRVEYFLPLPLKDQQDDILMLLQYSHESHNSVQSLIWNGISFESSLPIPCHRFLKPVSDLQCLLDSFSSTIQGSSLFSKLEDIFLIIPGFSQNSLIFRFHIELLPANSELLDIFEHFMILNSWFDKQHQIISEAQDFLETPDDVLIQKALEMETSELDYVETPELEFSGYASEIYLNDHLWSEEDSEINLDSLINLIEDLDKNLENTKGKREKEKEKENFHIFKQMDLSSMALRGKRELPEDLPLHSDQLIYDKVSVEELEIENLNGHKFFVQNKILNFPGEIELQELEVFEGIDKNIAERQMIEENWVVQGDLEFDYINDIKWSEFKENIVLRNQPQEFEALDVEGEIIMEDTLSIKSLNTLNFPEDYLLANGPRSSIVHAEKTFLNSLSANSVDTEGLINGENPLDAITLMDQQQWRGFPVFNHLEVSEKLELQGTAHGRNVDNSPNNPTLKESKTIEASCIFNDLTINGPIVLKGDLDNKPLAELLTDITQRLEDPFKEIEINSKKIFNDVTFPIDFELESDKINDIESDNFVTVHTKQSLNINSLDGYVYFYNLTLKGSYDDIKVEDIARDVITLDKPLNLGKTQLIFENQTLQADTLIVLEQLNDVDIKTNLQTLHEDLVLDSVEFEQLEGQVAEFSSDILGPGKLNNIELEAFVNDRSWHEPPIQGNLFIKELIAPLGIETDELHGINSEDLLEFLEGIDELPEMVLNGQIQVDYITVMGDVQMHKVNNLMFDEDIQMTAIWLNRPNHLTTNLTFQDKVEVKGNLKLSGNYQGKKLSALFDDFVRKDLNSLPVEIKAPKSFLYEVKVKENSQISAINGRKLENLAFKTKQNIFQGSLKIKGNLITPEIEVPHSFTSQLNLQELENFIYYDPQLCSFVFKGLTEFKNPLILDDLTVQASYNNFPNLTEFFNSLIDKSQPSELKGNYSFTGRVAINEGLDAFNLNGINLPELFQNLVYIQGIQASIIDTQVNFEDPIKIHKLSILKSLKTKEINECSLEEWLNDTLRVDQDQDIPYFLQFSKNTLDGNSLKVHYLNDIDMKRVLTLNTPQMFEESVQFSELILNGFIQANGSVNNLDLEKEYNNTLMIYGGQHIYTPLSIQSIEVLNDLEIQCLINQNKDLNDVALLTENLDLKSPVYFRSLHSPQFVTKDLITGIDFNKWFETSLRAEGRPLQQITGNWSASWLDVKTETEDFEYLPNNNEYWDYNSFIRNVRSFGKEQQEICEILKTMWNKLQQKSVKIKHVEEHLGIDSLPLNSTVKRRKMFHMKWGPDVVLLINLDCHSFIYKWNVRDSKFEFLNSYESGFIDQVMTVGSQDEGTLKFVTNYESTEPMNCSMKGFNLWAYGNNFTKHERAFEENVREFYGFKHKKDSLFILTENAVKELNLSSYEIQEKLLFAFQNKPETENSYRFLSNKDSPDIVVTNGRESLIVGNERTVNMDPKPFSSPLQPWPSVTVSAASLPTSLLKPNSTMARKFIFSDFQQTLQRLILDVIEKLSHQVTITQLTIPESDLYDEHLLPDFLAAIAKLQKQKIFNKSEFKLNFSLIIPPENPAHVLATRVVLIVWPKIEELQEIHGFLKDNDTHNHPICKNLTLTLGSLMQKVLTHAYPPKYQDHYRDLVNVVEIIHNYQKELQEIEKSLQKYERNEEDLTLDAIKPQPLKSHDNLQFVPIKKESLKPARKPEIITLTVGSLNNPHYLWASTKPYYPSKSAGFDSSIYLQADHLQTDAFQIIPSSDPHSLMQIRLGAETLFGYIENCCRVQLWKYQGVRGFVKFASFQSDTLIQQILSIKVPVKENGSKQLLAMLLKDGVQFYEITLQGVLYDPLLCK